MGERTLDAGPAEYDTERRLLQVLFAPPEDILLAVKDYRVPGAAVRLVRTAAEWGVTPALCRRLGPDAPVASPLLAHLKAISRREAAKVRRIAARGSNALEALLDAGISAACFKGVAMITRDHAVPERSMSDVDLLVTEDSLAEALAVLERIGFRIAVNVSFGDYVAFIRGAPHFSGNLAVPLVDHDGVYIDLHWGFGAACGPMLHPNKVLERSVPGTAFGNRIRRFSRTDLLLFAAHHAVRENLAPAATVKNLLDIASLDHDVEAIDEAVLAGAGPPAIALLACVVILARWQRGAAIRAHLDQAIDTESRPLAFELARVFERQIDAEPVNRDIVHLLHRTTIAEVLRTAFVHPKRNRKIMESLGGLPDRQRFWRFFADLRRLSREDFRLYRSLARAKRNPFAS